jgi:TM2 domain-containing membrane protein YozV
MEKFYDVNDPRHSRGGKTVVRKGPPLREEKDPSEAYSRSKIYWGGGQFYNDEVGRGTVFLIIEMLLLGMVALAIIYRVELVGLLRDRGMSVSDVFLGGEVLILLALFFWAYNAADAYQHAARTRKTRFVGVRSRITPLLASLVAPGWGQFLNGQPLKGSVHAAIAVIGFFSLCSVVLTFIAWPVLDASDSRFIIEGVSAVALIILPLLPPFWAFSAYDALKVSSDELLKEPLWERIKAAYYRGRNQGWIDGVFPRVKNTFLLLLFLFFFVIVVYYWFPVRYYAGLLSWVKGVLSDRGMTIVPELIDRVLAWLVVKG